MSAVGGDGGPRPSVDSAASPTMTFFTGAGGGGGGGGSGGDSPLPGVQMMTTAASTGARRGSFLFRCESDERADHSPATVHGGMVVSASAARLTSLVQTNQLPGHETFVS